MSTTTRERIVDEAMRLFSRAWLLCHEHRQDRSRGRTHPREPGGIYHHFKSKEAVLAAGIERQLARLERAARDPPTCSARWATSKPN